MICRKSSDEVFDCTRKPGTKCCEESCAAFNILEAIRELTLELRLARLGLKGDEKFSDIPHVAPTVMTTMGS